jgi:hypothetical protein
MNTESEAETNHMAVPSQLPAKEAKSEDNSTRFARIAGIPITAGLFFAATFPASVAIPIAATGLAWAVQQAYTWRKSNNPSP